MAKMGSKNDEISLKIDLKISYQIDAQNGGEKLA
jgi:hypothetical protein